ncbi:MAG: IPT/TIG domain-containing protein [Candidatus Latescibacteria bacterium]|nr:IPT/TIG domain-containing protein [Candidatus Latescibacterota bacterium]
MDQFSEKPEEQDADRRAFLKEGMKRAALLPYVAPVIETVFLSDADADDDDDGGGRGNTNSGTPSPIGNNVPPPLPAPRVRNVHPNKGFLGEEISVSIQGDNFRNEARAEFGTGISVQSMRFNSSRLLTAVIRISEYTSPGRRDVTVINPDRQSDTKSRAFEVKRPPRPEISSLNPNEGRRGQTLYVTIKGKDFRENIQTSFGSGITVLTEQFIDSKTLSVQIRISSSTSEGYRDVTVVNTDRQEDTKNNAFRVRDSSGSGSGSDDGDDDDG